MCIRIGFIKKFKNVAHNTIAQNWSKIAKIAKIVKFRDFSQLWGTLIPKICHLSKFPCTHILICSVSTKVPKLIWIGEKIRPQWPFKISTLWKIEILRKSIILTNLEHIHHSKTNIYESIKKYIHHLEHRINAIPNFVGNSVTGGGRLERRLRFVTDT